MHGRLTKTLTGRLEEAAKCNVVKGLITGARTNVWEGEKVKSWALRCLNDGYRGEISGARNRTQMIILNPMKPIIFIRLDSFFDF